MGSQDHITAQQLNPEELFPPDFKTWCYDDLALSEKEQRYPVLFYVHGAGGAPHWGTLICEDLASTGYIVLAIGHKDSGTFKRRDGKLSNVSEGFVNAMLGYAQDADLYQYYPANPTERMDEDSAVRLCRNVLASESADRWTKYAERQSLDIRFAADLLAQMDEGAQESMFKGRLGLETGIGVFGHSFGGPTSALVCRDDDRFACGISLDGAAYGVVDSDLNKPFMVLGSDASYNLNAVLGATNSEKTYFALVDQAVHHDFSDFSFTARVPGYRGPRDALEMRTIVLAYTKTFFDRHLLQGKEDVEALAFDGVDLIVKPGK